MQTTAPMSHSNSTTTLWTVGAVLASVIASSALFAGLWTGSALSLVPAVVGFFAAAFCLARRIDAETLTSEAPTPRVDRRPHVRHSIPAFG